MDNEKLTVKIGCSTLDRKMTRKQAENYGKRNMPADLKKAGFNCVVARARMDFNGWDGYRINYGK